VGGGTNDRAATPSTANEFAAMAARSPPARTRPSRASATRGAGLGEARCGPGANEFAAGTSRSPPARTGPARASTARVAAGSADRGRMRTGARPPPSAANEFAASRLRGYDDVISACADGSCRTPSECTGAKFGQVKPRAVCEAFRSRCGDFSRSGAGPTQSAGLHPPQIDRRTFALSHFRTFALSHFRTFALTHSRTHALPTASPVCTRHRAAYMPPAASRASCVPCSTMRPPSIT
jgi:hypothetical protein